MFFRIINVSPARRPYPRVSLHPVRQGQICGHINGHIHKHMHGPLFHKIPISQNFLVPPNFSNVEFFYEYHVRFSISKYPRITQMSRFSRFSSGILSGCPVFPGFFIWPIFPRCHVVPDKLIRILAMSPKVNLHKRQSGF